MPVLDELVASLDLLDYECAKPLTVQKHGNVLIELDAQGQSCLRVGSQAVDLGYAKAARQGVATVALANCHHQLMFVPYMQQIAERGVDLLATWNEEDGQVIGWFSAENAHPTLYRYPFPPNTPIPNRATDSLHINFSRDHSLGLSEEMSAEFEVTSPEQFAAHFAHHRDNGIQVSKDSWAKLTEVGKGVLVASSAESRERGAGGV